MEREPPHRSHGAAHPALDRVRRESRWWWLQARHARRVWRWALLAAAAVFVLLVLVRKPLADWFWDEPQIEQLLAEGDRALSEGRLTAADGSGARERYQAVLAIDGDRPQARQGLARTGAAALQQSRERLQAGDLDGCAQALALARELQVPRAEADAVAQQLQARRRAGAGIGALLAQARNAFAAGRLDDGDSSALPLFQRVLALQPDNLPALEGREDALSDLLQQARAQAGRGELATAAAILQRARQFDPGHSELPASQEALARAIDQRLQQGQRALKRQQLETAADSFQAVLAVTADDPTALRGREQVVQALLARSQKRADDFQFEAADKDAALAAGLGASQAAQQQLAQRLQRARQARQSLQQPGISAAQRERQLRDRLRQIDRAERAGQWISPPGHSAFDALREAQALAPRDSRVKAAAARLLPASRSCFDDNLRQNRVQAAGACLQAWQTLAPTATGLPDARARLAQRWLAIGSERLGRGDVAFAERALEQANQLGAGPATAEYQQLQERLRDIGSVPP
ncbi:membrane protein [Stenotrophomonas maltophilia 5BA-I-2]|nr:membrane protein [Stenotrophomonas maltophilia 5BA-I-2]